MAYSLGMKSGSAGVCGSSGRKRLNGLGAMSPWRSWLRLTRAIATTERSLLAIALTSTSSSATAASSPLVSCARRRAADPAARRPTTGLRWQPAREITKPGRESYEAPQRRTRVTRCRPSQRGRLFGRAPRNVCLPTPSGAACSIAARSTAWLLATRRRRRPRELPPAPLRRRPP